MKERDKPPTGACHALVTPSKPKSEHADKGDAERKKERSASRVRVIYVGITAWSRGDLSRGRIARSSKHGKSSFAS